MLSHSIPRLGLFTTKLTMMFKALKMCLYVILNVYFVLVSSVTNVTLPNTSTKVINNHLH